MLLVYLWYSSLCTLTHRFLPLMTLCLFLLELPLVGVLILGLPHISLLSSIIYSLGFLIIAFDLFLTYIPFPLKDVNSCMLSSLMFLSVFLLFSFVLLLRFIGVALSHMVCFSWFSFIDSVRFRFKGLPCV